MREFEVTTEDNCRLWACESGQTHGPVFVVLHGGPGLADYTEPIADQLADHGRVIRFDQRGCGESDSTGPYTLAQAVSDVHAVAQHVSPVPKVHVVGHSWGANLGLHYTLAHSDRVASLAYLNGTGLGTSWHGDWLHNREHRWDAKFRRKIERLSQIKRTETQEKELLLMLWESDFARRFTARMHATQLTTRWTGVNYDANRELVADLEKLEEAALEVECKELTLPFLVVHGSADPRPGYSTDTLRNAVSHATYREMNDCAHYPFLEDPTEHTKILTEFYSSEVFHHSTD